MQALLATHKRLIITFLIFICIIAILGIPFTQWWLTGDDFHGIFLGYKTTSFRDLFYFFYEGNTNQGVGFPGGAVLDRPSFLSVYYRPFHCVFLALQYWLFGTHGYGYFLCNIFFHATNAALLFCLCSYFVSMRSAALTAILFAVHPQIAYRFGSVVNLHYYINVFYVLLIALSLKKFIDSRNRWFYGAALCCYTLSLFTRETTLALPPIIGLGMTLYQNRKSTCNLKQFFSTLPEAILRGLPFACIALVFLGIRLYLYPFVTAEAHSNFLPYALKGNSFFSKIPELLVMLYDFLWLSWLPWGHKLFKGIMLCLSGTFLAFLWWRSTAKFIIGFIFGSALFMLWPGLISFYSPRYFYESAAFALVGYLMLFYSAHLKIYWRNVLFVLLSFFALLLSIFTYLNFCRREKKLAVMDRAVHSLAHQVRGKNRALCFLCTPNDGFAGGNNPAIFWILLNNRFHPLFFDVDLAITQHNANVVEQTPFCMMASDYFTQDYVSIEPIEGGFHIKSTNPSKIIFSFKEGAFPSIGTKIIHAAKKTPEGQAVTDFTLLLDSGILNLNPIFLTWSFQKQNFTELTLPEML